MQKKDHYKEGREGGKKPVPKEVHKEMARLKDISVISPKKRQKLYIPVRV